MFELNVMPHFYKNKLLVNLALLAQSKNVTASFTFIVTLLLLHYCKERQYFL